MGVADTIPNARWASAGSAKVIYNDRPVPRSPGWYHDRPFRTK